MSFYDFLQNFGRKAHEARENLANFGVESDEFRLNVANFAVSPVKYFVLSILSLGTYPFSILTRLFKNHGVRPKNTLRFLRQLERIAISRGVAPNWTAKGLTRSILRSYRILGVVFFVAGGIHAHGSSGEPMIYHAPPIIAVATIPLVICVFQFINTINQCAGLDIWKNIFKLKFDEIFSLAFVWIIIFLFANYGINDNNSGLFSIFDPNNWKN